MIEVIKRGDYDPKERVTCHRCKSILEFSTSDMLSNTEYDHVMKLQICRSYIICPICHETIKVGVERAYDML